jgi:hypothetical protein
VGLNYLDLERNITVFPNPSNGSFHIRSSQLVKLTSIRVINELGVLVLDKKLQESELNNFKLNQPSGMYLLELTDENGRRTIHRIVIQD